MIDQVTETMEQSSHSEMLESNLDTLIQKRAKEVGGETLNLNSRLEDRSDSRQEEKATFGVYGATGVAIGATAALAISMMRKQQKASIDDRDEDFHRV